MPDPYVPKVLAPASFVPEHALAFGAAGADAVPVSTANPLPIAMKIAATTATALAGTTSATGSFGPFAPELGRAIVLTLSGTWAGTVQLLRSTDGGATRLPLTIAGQSWASYTGNCNEQVATESEAAASYYLSVTLTSGTLAYRVAQ